ncbi:MAG: PaaI family thioesterase [Acidimicrobiales bacterium]|jgi:hypothetical protein|nr:PaaI family thioesterase [Acidimicrobiales bacterium]
MSGPEPTHGESLSAAIRELIEVVRTADLEAADAESLRSQTATVEAVTAAIRPHVVDGIRMQAALSFEGLDADSGARMIDVTDLTPEEFVADDRPQPDEIFPYSPVVGPLNPVSPPVRLWRAIGETGGELHGEAKLGDAYNGPPESVHGGVIAEVFDELLGCLCVSKGIGGFTGTLTVVYRSPTPLNTPIRLRAWHDRTEGRKVFAKGTMYDGDTLCAEAEGIFILSDQLSGGGTRPGSTKV